MTFRDLTGHLSFLGLRLQHRALVEEAKYLKAEAIRREKENKQKTKQTGRKQSHIRESSVWSLPYLLAPSPVAV